MIEKVLIFSDTRVPWGANTQSLDGNGKQRFNPIGTTSLIGTVSGDSTNIARGVFVGAQALALAFGQAYEEGRAKWFEELNQSKGSPVGNDRAKESCELLEPLRLAA